MPASAAPTDWSRLTDDDWKARLTPAQYEVLRRKGTEPPFCGGYTAFKAAGSGEYACSGCGLHLFSGRTSFDSGSGWPSFWEPIAGAVASQDDSSHGMRRTEVHCARCGGHLGHVFDDGPAPTGRRYCINAISLERMRPGAVAGSATAAATAPPASGPATTQTATFAGGCFWGVEAVFRAVPGVIDAKVGYMGGRTDKPTYKDICHNDTGHAEVCQVTFDPARLSFGQLLVVFFENHDPTTLNRQGPDIGDQYRSAVFTHEEAQRRLAAAFIAEMNRTRAYRRPVVTQVVPAATFWTAEDYHQQYFSKQGLSADQCHRPTGVRVAALLPAAETAAAMSAAAR